jgi:hypothetical protein
LAFWRFLVMIIMSPQSYYPEDWLFIWPFSFYKNHDF